MPELTQDEFTVLLIATEGELMIPIGRWREPILALTERGLMQKNDDVNYAITSAGREAVSQRNEDDETELRGLLARGTKTIDAGEVEPPIAGELKDE